MKNTFKIIAFILTLTLVFTFIGCKSQEKASDSTVPTLDGLIKQGFQCSTYIADDTVWNGLFQKEDSYDVLYKVSAKITPELSEELDSIDFFAEDSAKQITELLSKTSDVTVTDITSVIPSKEKLDAFIGKTIGEIEAEGYSQAGFMITDERTSLSYEGPEFIVALEVDGIFKDGEIPEDQLPSLVVTKAEFEGISNRVLEG